MEQTDIEDRLLSLEFRIAISALTVNIFYVAPRLVMKHSVLIDS
jgi:hypothetical protein